MPAIGPGLTEMSDPSGKRFSQPSIRSSASAFASVANADSLSTITSNDGLAPLRCCLTPFLALLEYLPERFASSLILRAYRWLKAASNFWTCSCLMKCSVSFNCFSFLAPTIRDSSVSAATDSAAIPITITKIRKVIHIKRNFGLIGLISFQIICQP